MTTGKLSLCNPAVMDTFLELRKAKAAEGEG